MKKQPSRFVRPLLVAGLIFSSVAITTPIWQPLSVEASASVYQSEVNRYNQELVSFYDKYYTHIDILEDVEYIEDFIDGFLLLKNDYETFLKKTNNLVGTMNGDMKELHGLVKDMVEVDYELVHTEYLYYIDELDEAGYDKRYDEWDAHFDSTLEEVIVALQAYSQKHGVLYSEDMQILLGEEINVEKSTITPPAISSPEPVSPNTDVHVVEKGDTLYSLARQYDVTVSELKTYNGLTSDVLSIGQRINVPKTVAVVQPSYVYVVVKGDTLYGIARRYGLSVEELQKLNQLKTTSLFIGQVLTVAHTHTVGKGDTLYRISQTYGVTVDELKEWNGLTHTTIALGQILIVGGK